MNNNIKLLQRSTFEADRIVAQFPPRFTDTNKKLVYGISCPEGCKHSGTITFSRWEMAMMPSGIERLEGGARIRCCAGYFDYESREPENILWTLNFANYNLFSAYSGSLFAQDEMQVTEHPALASLRSALQEKGIPTLCVEGSTPTPVLIHGVERRCIVHTEPNSSLGRPSGLYGNNFANAAVEAIRQATEPLEPPTISNILAMEAPSYGYGQYTREVLMYVFKTAATGFSAAVAESNRLGFQAENVEIHTGYWGCGAYGGNRVLMLLLQMIAAVHSNVGNLYFYLGDCTEQDYRRAEGILEEILPTCVKRSLDDVIGEIESMEFVWGISNGT